MPGIRRTVVGVAGLAAVVLLGGCSTYDTRYNYAPHSGEIAVNIRDTPNDPDAVALVTVVGIRNQLPDEPKRKGVDVRVRVEAVGPVEVAFDPATVTLVDGELEAVAGPIAPPEPIALTEGESAVVTLTYPLAEGVRLSGEQLKALNVRVPVTVAGQLIERNIGFERQDAGGREHIHYHYPAAYPYYHRGYLRHW